MNKMGEQANTSQNNTSVLRVMWGPYKFKNKLIISVGSLYVVWRGVSLLKRLFSNM